LDEGWMYGYLSIQMHKLYQTIQINRDVYVACVKKKSNIIIF